MEQMLFQFSKYEFFIKIRSQIRFDPFRKVANFCVNTWNTSRVAILLSIWGNACQKDELVDAASHDAHYRTAGDARTGVPFPLTTGAYLGRGAKAGIPIQAIDRIPFLDRAGDQRLTAFSRIPARDLQIQIL